MAVSLDMDIVGIKDAMRELNNIDKVARREITRDFKRVMQKTVNEAQARVPINAPISGFNRNWTTKSGYQILPWYLNTNDAISSGVSGKRPKMFGGVLQNVAVFFIKFTGPTSILFDMSGKGPVPTTQGGNMVKGLSDKFGPPSRVLWPVVEANIDEIEARTKEIVARVMDLVNQGLAGAMERARQRELKKAA